MSDKEGLKIETRVLDEAARISMVAIDGFVDQANSHLLQKVIDTCIADEYYNLVFNLQNLVYMSSAGWGVLIGEIKRFRENGGDIKLANMGPEIYEIYQMLEFYHIINEYASVEEAVKGFGSKVEGVDTYSSKSKSSTYEESTPSRPKPKSPPPVEETPPVEFTPEPEPEPEAEPEPEPEPEAETPPSTSFGQDSDGVISEEEIDLNIDGILASEGIVKSGGDGERTGYVEFDISKFEREVDVKVRPVPDKVRDIIAQHPDYGIFKIKRTLNSPDYGNVRMGFWKLRSLLKALELDTKEKRYRFFRSA